MIINQNIGGYICTVPFQYKTEYTIEYKTDGK